MAQRSQGIRKESDYNMATVTSVIPDIIQRVVGRNRLTAEILFITGKIANGSLATDAQEVTKTDAEGSVIQRWMNAKTATFTGDETFWNLDLYSQQLNGEGKTIGTTGSGVVVPISDPIKTYTAEDTLTTYVLQYSAANVGTTAAPAYKISVCTLNKDGTPNKKFKLGTEAGTGVFEYDATTHTLTFASGAIAVGDKLFVEYDFNSEDCVAVIDSADKFPEDIEIVVEGLFKDACSNAQAGYTVFPKAQLSASTTASFGRTDTFPFSFSAQQDYCDENKQLFRQVFPTLPTTP